MYNIVDFDTINNQPITILIMIFYTLVLTKQSKKRCPQCTDSWATDIFHVFLYHILGNIGKFSP